ncbi:MAG: hypothetical protein ACI8WT_001470 [Clostridium sp.]|jgi:hypothetical protein
MTISHKGLRLNFIKTCRKAIKPATFLGVAGMKLFRDEIWDNLRFPFIADHKAFKAHGLYAFPQRNYKSIITNFILNVN